MSNWVKKIETAMADCPSAEEMEKEVKVSGGITEEDELDKAVPNGNSNS